MKNVPDRKNIIIYIKSIIKIKLTMSRFFTTRYFLSSVNAIHYHTRREGRIVKRAVYIALGIDMNGKKDVLEIYVGENESAKFWLSMVFIATTYNKYFTSVMP